MRSTTLAMLSLADSICAHTAGREGFSRTWCHCRTRIGTHPHKHVGVTAQVIAITDGEPAGEPSTTILNVIKGAKQMCANSQYGPGAIAFEFAQVRSGQRWSSVCRMSGH